MFVTAYRTVCYKYPHMAIGKVWIYRLRLLYVCLFQLFVCLFFNFVRLRISPARIKLSASNFARWFIGVLGMEIEESPILGNFAPPEAQNQTNRLSTRK